MPDKASQDPGTYAVRWGLGRVAANDPTHASGHGLVPLSH